MAPARGGAGLGLTWLDVFTAVPLAGNALAVVHDADGLDDETMLRFARETRLSETTFVQAAAAPGADYRNRIWMMSGELAFAGHPSLGTAVAVAHARGDETTRYVQETTAGLQPVDVERASGGYRAAMLQEPARFGAELDPEVVFAAVGLEAADAHPELPAQVVDTGVPQVVACVADAAVLDRTAPRLEPLRDLLARTRAVTAYLVHLDGREERASARSFFAAPAAVAEDPATGGAAGTLMAYLHARTGARRLVIDQGVAMGRPSRLECEVAGDRVRVGGDVVVVAEGRVHLG
jgi:trans-2,3-dihydro-3-hydroxyanthranilate isomerase